MKIPSFLLLYSLRKGLRFGTSITRPYSRDAGEDCNFVLHEIRNKRKSLFPNSLLSQRNAKGHPYNDFHFDFNCSFPNFYSQKIKCSIIFYHNGCAKRITSLQKLQLFLALYAGTGM